MKTPPTLFCVLRASSWACHGLCFIMAVACGGDLLGITDGIPASYNGCHLNLPGQDLQFEHWLREKTIWAPGRRPYRQENYVAQICLHSRTKTPGDHGRSRSHPLQALSISLVPVPSIET
ncbi:hypothetical protein K458DRAFT_8137 [Lentithecium fluviatile CBS 122367]|uniref:Secreted protein n=1 Tax=Lentithecium fluviatile CBS 122367 TaxID=1168545 RepID=A0A6G1JNY2_9PLEO|nr:hypothetical protein K458DRAFT_8137 [Lentithecium fluviatile CBS 122367]